jgi:PAS domain S-box-containing protein
MQWLEALSDADELRHCVRDLIALSTLPAGWKNYEPRQMAESMASALVSMINADFVHLSVPSAHDERRVEITCGSGVADDFTDAIEASLQEWTARGHPHASTMSGPREWRIACAKIDFDGSGVLLAGSRDSDFPHESHRLLLRIAAGSVGIALQHWHAEKAERRFKELIEKSSDFIGLAGMDGRPHYINEAGLQLLGLESMERASGLHVLDFLVPEERQRARDELWPMVMRSGRWIGELNFVHWQTGAAIPFLVDWFRVDDPHTGRPMNIATVSRILTAQKQHEAALRHLNETLEGRVAERTSELAEANTRLRVEIRERQRTNARVEELQLALFHAGRVSALGQLAAALAHEINQPLTAAVNSINAARRLLAKNADTTPSPLTEILNEAAVQSIRAGQIVHRSREFVKRGETDKSPQDVAALIKEAGTIALIGSDAASVSVAFHLAPNVSRVSADRIQIQQVLANLMRNAVEAMAGRKRRELAISTAMLDQETVEVAVADSGPGLTLKMREHVFDPFVSTKRHGMGLGLSICRTIVEAHGGKLRCESNGSGGAVFRFTLPAVSAIAGGNAA